VLALRKAALYLLARTGTEGRDRAGNPGGSHCLVARTGAIDSAPTIAMTSRLLFHGTSLDVEIFIEIE
jgi:hypothetical protein